MRNSLTFRIQTRSSSLLRVPNFFKFFISCIIVPERLLKKNEKPGNGFSWWLDAGVLLVVVPQSQGLVEEP